MSIHSDVNKPIMIILLIFGKKTILVNCEIKLWSATTLLIMTFRTMTLCTKDLNVALFIITLSMCDIQHNNALPLY
jgi:hypothetical protein